MNTPATPSGFDRIVRNFAPSWFAAVMGTGVLAIGAMRFSETYPVLKPVGTVLHGFNLVLFLLLLLPWTLRWFRYRAAALGALRHPVMGQFYATIAIASLVLAFECVIYGEHVALAAGLWTVGVLGSLLFSFVGFWTLFNNPDVTLDQVTPGMFLPPVGLVVVPLAGLPLMGQAAGSLRELLFLVNVACLGAGFFLWLGLLALTVHRFVLGRPMPGALLPTLWINLGPIGVVCLGLVGLAETLSLAGIRETLPLAALLLWGFGAWWLVMAGALTLSAWRRGELPFSLTWWAFTFPLGAFANASHRLATTFALEAVWAVGFAAFVLLFFLWGITLVKSIRGTISGSLFADAPTAAR